MCVVLCLLTSLPPPRCWIRVQPRAVSGPQRSRRRRFDAPESFSKLTTEENQRVNRRRSSARAGSLPLTRVILPAGLPRTEKRRRVCVQHQGVPQGLHIIPRRGKTRFSAHFCRPGCLVATPWCEFSHPGVALANVWRLLNPCERRGAPAPVNNGSMELLTGGGGGDDQPRTITHQPSASAANHQQQLRESGTEMVPYPRCSHFTFCLIHF